MFVIRHITLALYLVLATSWCKPEPFDWGDGDTDAALDVGPDADVSGDAAPDADQNEWDGDPLDPCGPPVCGDVELCGPTGRGDGLNNNCDRDGEDGAGLVDEGCRCVAMTDSIACFPGPPDRRNIGVCSDGVQTCSEFETWNSCVGAVVPADEVCDGMDNDCNGEVDEGLTGCVTDLHCPGNQSARPLASFPLLGSGIYGGSFTSWSWTVECPSTIPAGSCPQPTDAAAQDTEVYFIASGSYRVFAEIETSTESFRCSFAVRVRGEGLRVELNWDTQGDGRGNTDVDLHLHQPGTRGDFFTAEDCYYNNCKASNYAINWGLAPTTDLAVCVNAPHGEGEIWREIGTCNNPRLDVDVIRCDPAVTDATSDQFCAPENINVDDPGQGAVYRVMVNYFEDRGYTGITHPRVNIYCGGELRAAFGMNDEVELIHGDERGSTNDCWAVADVRYEPDECGNASCVVSPLGNIAESPFFDPDWTL